MSAFDDATAVVAREDGTTFDVGLDGAWTIGPDRPNGGYLLAILGRAAVAACQAAGGTQRDVVAANVQYVTSPTVGPAVVVADVLRVGRTASQLRCQLLQGEQVCVDALFTMGHLHVGSEPWWGDVPAVALDPVGEGARGFAREMGDGPSIRDRVHISFDEGSSGFTRGEPGGSGELRGWFRFADGREPDPLALLLVVDGFPPATFDIVFTGWVPTLNLTAYIRAIPAPGPLRIRFRVGVIADGFADEICEVWDSRGSLVAQSTQLTALRVPEGASPPRPDRT